jgi:hypothetical protein
MKRTLLVDADIVAYKFAAANEQVFYFEGGDSDPSSESDLEGALGDAEEYLAELKGRLGATDLIVCLTDPASNFRTTIDPTYKGNRKGVRKPEHLSAVKEWFKGKYPTYQRPALEADDCMGILATHPTLVKGEKIIVSEDKDMATIPGLLFNPAKDKEPRKISKLAADRFHLWQTIVGDTADGYPGAPGIGGKSPEAIAVMAAKSAEEAWLHVTAAFVRSLQRRLLPEPIDWHAAATAAATVQARLARILRASDWDFAAKKPRLWQPPL